MWVRRRASFGDADGNVAITKRNTLSIGKPIRVIIAEPVGIGCQSVTDDRAVVTLAFGQPA